MCLVQGYLFLEGQVPLLTRSIIDSWTLRHHETAAECLRVRRKEWLNRVRRQREGPRGVEGTKPQLTTRLSPYPSGDHDWHLHL